MPVEEDDVAGVEDRGLLAGADQGVGLGTVERARRFLHAHLAHPELDVRRVAQAAHVSPAHPVPRFRAEVAVTPMAYLRQRRVSTAIDLLTNTGLPVGEIAARSASDPSTTSPAPSCAATGGKTPSARANRIGNGVRRLSLTTQVSVKSR